MTNLSFSAIAAQIQTTTRWQIRETKINSLLVERSITVLDKLCKCAWEHHMTECLSQNINTSFLKNLPSRALMQQLHLDCTIPRNHSLIVRKISSFCHVAVIISISQQFFGRSAQTLQAPPPKYILYGHSL